MSTARTDPAGSAAGASESAYVDPYEPEYPQDDGEPMAESTLQYQWIVTIKEGLEALYADRGDVFVAADLLWYATERDARDVVAPDVLVVFGRPKGHRRSYREWVEAGVVPQVVFEIESPSNTAAEMERKLGIYDRRGVEEYYHYDPESGKLEGWFREGDALVAIADVEGWRSPRLGITFEAPPARDSLVVRGPDGERFRTYAELSREAAELSREAAELSREVVELSREAAAAERLARRESGLRRRAERELKDETRRADAETRRADAERLRREEAEEATRAALERAERMAALLRERGLDVD